MQVTSYLMMGALSPGLKRHSVTLFEGESCQYPIPLPACLPVCSGNPPTIICSLILLLEALLQQVPLLGEPAISCGWNPAWAIEMHVVHGRGASHRR